MGQCLNMNWEIKKIESKATYPWLLEKHYAHRIPSISVAFGLLVDGNLIGVCTFGVPPSPPLRKGVCGENYSNCVLELNRLCLDDGHDKEIASWFVSRCLRTLPHPTVVVSYADLAQNHIGYVYQACNFFYTGLSAKRTDWSIKGKEGKHGVTIADESRGQEHRAEWMRAKYGSDFSLKPRGRKHRYIYFVGSKREVKEMKKELRYPVLPYPKGDTHRYEINSH